VPFNHGTPIRETSGQEQDHAERQNHLLRRLVVHAEEEQKPTPQVRHGRQDENDEHDRSSDEPEVLARIVVETLQVDDDQIAEEVTDHAHDDQAYAQAHECLPTWHLERAERFFDVPPFDVDRETHDRWQEHKDAQKRLPAVDRIGHHLFQVVVGHVPAGHRCNQHKGAEDSNEGAGREVADELDRPRPLGLLHRLFGRSQILFELVHGTVPYFSLFKTPFLRHFAKYMAC